MPGVLGAAGAPVVTPVEEKSPGPGSVSGATVPPVIQAVLVLELVLRQKLVTRLTKVRLLLFLKTIIIQTDIQAS